MNTYSVDPARLQCGTWCHRTEDQMGRGDIAGSYSADRIGMNEPLRRPFQWKGSLWVCVGQDNKSAEAYQLSHPQAFMGPQTTYREKTIDDAARSDVNGFYHGMTASHGRTTYVLSGPPALFVAGEVAQMDLFGS